MVFDSLRRLFAPPSTPVAASPPTYVDRWWTAADGLRLYARDYAAAAGPARTPVICIHGLTRNAADFGEVAPWIAARGRRVLAVDVRGRGRSAFDPQPMNYVPTTYVADVLGLMDAAGIARAVFVGTSMGGIITMLAASFRPAAIAAAVLNDVGPSLNPDALKRIAEYTGRAAPVEDWAGAVAYARTVNQVAFPAYGPADWEAFARRLFVEGENGRPRLAYDPQIAAPFRANPGVLAADMTPLFTTLATGRPLLLIRGGLSDLLDAPRAASMRALAPQMAYAEVANVGHAPMLDEPEARTALAPFLDEAP